MTTDPTPSPADPPAEPPTAVQDPQAGPQDETDPNREAARYRRQLRAAETERDTLRATIETMQRNSIEEIARRDHGLTKPASLWAGGTTLADLIGDNGQIDTDKVTEAVTAAISTLGLAVERRHGGAYVPSEGRNTGTPASENAWSQFLRAPAQ